MACIRYENSFDSVHTSAVIDALRERGVDGTNIRIFNDIHMTELANFL